MDKTARISGFHRLSVSERLGKLQEFAALNDEEVALLNRRAHLDIETADRMIENVVGTFELPLGIATNLLINGKEYLVPLAVEESSVVAALSNAANMVRSGGGFFTTSTGPVMIAQIQLIDVPDPFGAKMKILERRDEIIAIANEQDPVLVSLGGGSGILKCGFLTRDGTYGDHSPVGGHQRRHGRQRCEHNGRGAREAHRSIHRRKSVAQNPVQPCG